MSTPHLENEFSEIGPPSQNGENGDASQIEHITTYLRNRFERLHRLTQPRAAMLKAQRDFERKREAEREAEKEERQLK